MRVGINLPTYGALSTVDTMTAIAVTAEQLGYVGAPNAIADRIGQYPAADVDEFVLDLAAPDQAAYIEHLHQFADTVLPLPAETR